MRWRACGLMCVLVFAAATAAAAERDWRGDHWGVFVAHTSATTPLSTSTDFVAPGYDLVAGSFFQDSSVPAVTASGRGSISLSGNSAGVSWGRDWQVGRQVSGIDLDLGRLNLRGSRSAGGPYPCCAAWGYQVAQSIDTEWVVTARGRIGHAFNRSLVYVTAGAVLARIHVRARFAENSEDAQATTALSKSQWGWALGVGYEYGLEDRWSVNAEVLHLDLGRASSASNNMVSSFGAYPAHLFTTQTRLRANQVRVGLRKRW